MRILIGATFAILVAALAYKFIADDSTKDEIAELKAEMKAQKEADQRNQLQQPYLAPTTYTPPVAQVPYTPPVVPPVTPYNPPTTLPEIAKTPEELAEIERLKAQVAAKDKALADSRKEAELNTEEGDAIREEINQRSQSEEARAALIMKAKVFAIVKDYHPESQIIQLAVQEGVQIQEGRHLCIRRGEAGGIAGRITVTGIQDNITAFANPIAGSFPGRKVDVRKGDEVIIDFFK